MIPRDPNEEALRAGGRRYNSPRLRVSGLVADAASVGNPMPLTRKRES